MYYKNELKALKKSNRYRTREILDSSLKDFASNDYLGLAHKKELHIDSCHELQKLCVYSPKASMLVNGYHQAHYDFEQALCKANGFEDGIVMGSGFNANLALIEALCRKGDVVFMDELYHASGVMATNIDSVHVEFFKHNDMDELKKLFLKYPKAKRKIIAVEGIYSMDGDLCSKDVFEIADMFDALLIVDEAHSSGVVGDNLMGIFDLYKIKIKPNYIKMGTLGKAYGSFGAYILASKHIVEYLLNRAKPVIYATSLSLYDTILAHNSLKYILKNKNSLKQEIKQRQLIVKKVLGLTVDGLIVPVVIGDNNQVMHIKNTLKDMGYMVGGIRQPTVKHAIIRLIARLTQSEDELEYLCRKILLHYKSFCFN